MHPGHGPPLDKDYFEGVIQDQHLEVSPGAPGVSTFW